MLWAPPEPPPAVGGLGKKLEGRTLPVPLWSYWRGAVELSRERGDMQASEVGGLTGPLDWDPAGVTERSDQTHSTEDHTREAEVEEP